MREELIVNRFKQGDESAFIEIYEMYFDDIYNFVCYSVPRDISEDLTQDIFIKVYNNMEKFKGKSTIKTWIFNIAKRSVYDWYRKKRSFLNLDDYTNTLTSSSTPEKLAESKEQISFIIQGLEGLKVEQRTVILLRKFYGFSIKETSEIMGYSEGKVKTILHRGLKGLKERLDDDYFEKEVQRDG